MGRHLEPAFAKSCWQKLPAVARRRLCLRGDRARGCCFVAFALATQGASLPFERLLLHSFFWRIHPNPRASLSNAPQMHSLCLLEGVSTLLPMLPMPWPKPASEVVTVPRGLWALPLGWGRSGRQTVVHGQSLEAFLSLVLLRWTSQEAA